MSAPPGTAKTPIELKVEYKRLNAFFADYCRNIVKGTTFIKTAKPLEIGTEFLFRLTVPTIGAPIILRGQVAWVKKEADAAAGGGEPGMGVRFIFQREEMKHQFHVMVEELMTTHMGERIRRRLLGGQ